MLRVLGRVRGDVECLARGHVTVETTLSDPACHGTDQKFPVLAARECVIRAAEEPIGMVGVRRPLGEAVSKLMLVVVVLFDTGCEEEQ